MEIENPWHGPAGRTARHNLFRLLAAADNGAVSDFAKDVVAGRREPRELATYAALPDELFERIKAGAEAWHRLPEDTRATVAEHAPELLAEHVQRLADMDVDDAEQAVRTEDAPRDTPAPRRGDDNDEPWFDEHIPGLH